jgi:hypothetical protein
MCQSGILNVLYLCACKNSVGIVGGTKKIKFFIFTFVFYHSRLADSQIHP